MGKMKELYQEQLEKMEVRQQRVYDTLGVEKLFNQMRRQMRRFLVHQYVSKELSREAYDYMKTDERQYHMIDELYKSVQWRLEHDFNYAHAEPDEIIEAIFDFMSNSMFHRIYEDCEDGEAGMIASNVYEKIFNEPPRIKSSN